MHAGAAGAAAAAPRAIVFVISAPSGAGKSTLVAELLASELGLTFSISYTTRAPRGSEQQGVDYNYVSRAEFEQLVAHGEFLEHAEVFGNFYGTHREAVTIAAASGKDLILDIDVQGARQLKEKIPEAVGIFILPPSREILEQRLRSRREDSEAVIQRRLKAAAAEIQNYEQYDYIVVNRDLEQSADALIAIVKAERRKRSRREDEIRPILESFERHAPETRKRNL